MSTSKSTRMFALAAVVCAVALVGCEENRHQQCNALITVINEAVDDRTLLVSMHKQTDGDPNDPEHLKKIANISDNAAKAAGALKLTDEKLKKHRDEYKELTETVAKIHREAAAAGGYDGTAVKTNKALKARNMKLQSDLNKYCQSDM